MRKRVLGIIVLVIALVWSWVIFYGPKGDGVSEETMVQIQDNLQDQIYQVLQKRPEPIENVKFEKFWTEEINSQTVKAHFVVTYEEPLSDDKGLITRKGSMVLTKLDETDQEQVWVAESVDIDGEQISFETGIRFSPTEEASDDEAEEALEDIEEVENVENVEEIETEDNTDDNSEAEAESSENETTDDL